MTADLAQDVILWGGVSGAIVAIIALVSKMVGAVKNAKTYFTDLKNNIDTLLEHDNEQYLAILRLTVMRISCPCRNGSRRGKSI